LTSKILNFIQRIFNRLFHVSLKIYPVSGTYLLTPWNTALLENLTGFQLVKKSPAFFWNPKIHYRIHKCSPPVSILSHLDPVHILRSYLLKIHLNIFLPSTPGSPKWLFPSRFTYKTLNTPLLSPIRATCHFHLIFLDFITRTVLGEHYSVSGT
jgi:hypothetical protein